MRGRYSGAQRKLQPPQTPSLPTRDTRAVTRSNMASQTKHTEPCAESSQLGTDQFQALMQAITGCQTTLTTKIEQMQSEMGLIRRDMDKYRDRLTEAERRVGDTVDTIREHGASLRILQVKMKMLESRAEDQENRNRRNNLRLVGLPGGQDPEAYTEQLLRTLLPQAQFSTHFAVERAHRMPSVRGPPGAPPRTFIFRMLNFRDRDLILKEARKVGELRSENTKIMLFPDYSVETQRQRRTFDQVKTQMRTRGLKYNMLFPARLRVVDGETTKFFISPEDASRWLESLPRNH